MDPDTYKRLQLSASRQGAFQPNNMTTEQYQLIQQAANMQNPQYSMNFRATPNNITPRLTSTPPITSNTPTISMYNGMGAISPANVIQNPQQQQQQQQFTMQAYLQHRLMQQQQQQQQQNDQVAYLQNQYYAANGGIPGVSATPTVPSGRLSTPSEAVQFMQTNPHTNTTSPTPVFLNNPNATPPQVPVNTHIPIQHQIHQQIPNNQQKMSVPQSTPSPVPNMGTALPQQQVPNSQTQGERSTQQSTTNDQQQQNLRRQQLKERHAAFTVDYKNPFKSKRDILQRLVPFRSLNSQLKEDAKWEEKIDNVAKKFLKSRGVAENYVDRAIYQEAIKELTTEEELLMDILTFRAEQSAWKQEKVQLEVERERQLEIQRLNQLKTSATKSSSNNSVGHHETTSVGQFYAVNDDDDFLKDSDMVHSSNQEGFVDAIDAIDYEAISMLDKIDVAPSDTLIKPQVNSTPATSSSTTGAVDYSDFMSDHFMDMPQTPADTDDYFNFE